MNNDPNQQDPNQPIQPNQNPYQQNPNQIPYNPNQPPYNPAQPGQQYQYPPQGFVPPSQPPKVKHTKRNLGIGCGALIVILALCGIISLVSSAGSKANTGTTFTTTGSTTTASSQSTKVPATSTHFKVGQVVKVGDWQVTVNSVKVSQGDEFDKPQKGQFLLLDVSVINTSSTEQTISSLLNFKLTDSTGITYTETFSGSSVPNPPDGKVEAGAPARGTFTYDVPTTMKSYTFAFEPDITASGESIWDIKP